MCGIGGILLPRPLDGRAPAVALDDLLDRLDAAIRPRGPDGEGRCSLGATHLVHRRLSIIDPRGGAQPMVIDAAGEPWRPTSDSRPSLALAFNGCIYNHRALRLELESLGERFSSDHSDTEVVLRSIRRWGADALPRLEGMFAVAAWRRLDGGEEELLLARDRCGEKPLHFLPLNLPSTRGGVVFSSSAAPLLAISHQHRPAPSNRDVACLVRWLAWGFCDEPLRNVHELAPGSWISFNTSGSTSRGTFGHRPATMPVAAEPLTIARAESLLRSAVHARLEADVPLGCFLSGGVDSSLVAAFASEVRPDLATFCVAMPHAAHDESDHARRVASILGTRHQTLECPGHAAADLCRLLGGIGLPFGDSSLLPTHWVSVAARQHVKVALSGDGGDELFRGYRRHQAARLLRRLGPVLGLAGKATRFMHGGLGEAGRLLTAAAGIGYPQISALFRPGVLSDLIGPDLAAACWREASETWTRQGVADAPWWDFACYLPGDLLRKVDTASMAAALEVRCPMLDGALVRACLGSTEASLIPDGERKGLLRAIARRRLPAAVVDRPKQGFAIPLGPWFREDFGGLGTLLGDMLTGPDPFPENVLGFRVDRRSVGSMVDEHRGLVRDHSRGLFALLSLAIWCRGMGRGFA
ncbi:MAG: asparagine synthase (glutamine-hydrolyzing) [Phycisphaerae bacterium]